MCRACELQCAFEAGIEYVHKINSKATAASGKPASAKSSTRRAKRTLDSSQDVAKDQGAVVHEANRPQSTRRQRVVVKSTKTCQDRFSNQELVKAAKIQYRGLHPGAKVADILRIKGFPDREALEDDLITRCQQKHS